MQKSNTYFTKNYLKLLKFFRKSKENQSEKLEKIILFTQQHFKTITPRDYRKTQPRPHRINVIQ